MICAGTTSSGLMPDSMRSSESPRKRVLKCSALTMISIRSRSAIRKFTGNRRIYSNQESALKIVCVAIREASHKWTAPIRKGTEALNHFAILVEGLLPKQSQSRFLLA